MVPGIPKSGHSCTPIQIPSSILICNVQKLGKMCTSIYFSGMYTPGGREQPHSSTECPVVTPCQGGYHSSLHPYLTHIVSPSQAVSSPLYMSFLRYSISKDPIRTPRNDPPGTMSSSYPQRSPKWSMFWTCKAQMVCCGDDWGHSG